MRHLLLLVAVLMSLASVGCEQEGSVFERLCEKRRFCSPDDFVHQYGSVGDCAEYERSFNDLMADTYGDDCAAAALPLVECIADCVSHRRLITNRNKPAESPAV